MTTLSTAAGKWFTHSRILFRHREEWPDPMTPCVECDDRMLTERPAVKDHTMCIRDRTHQSRPVTESRLVAGWGKIQATANRPELSLGVIRMFWS